MSHNGQEVQLLVIVVNNRAAEPPNQANDLLQVVRIPSALQ